jgi:hypothetical protein
MRMTGKALWRRLEAASPEERARRDHATLTERILDSIPYDAWIRERMGVSRGTVWRLMQRARRKVAQALTEGRRIQIYFKSD